MTSEESSKLLEEFNEILKTEDIDKLIYFFSKKIPEEIYFSFIYISIKNNKLLFIKEIIDNSVLIKVKKVLIDSINSINSSGMNFLFICYVDTNKIEILKLLLKLPDINVNIQDKYKENILHSACEENNIKIVKLLLAHPNIDVNIKNKYERTPLYIACRYNNIELAKLLLTHSNIDVNVKDVDGDTPLYYACKNNQIDIVKLLLEHPKIKIDFFILRKYKDNPQIYILLKNKKNSSLTKINQILDTIGN
jgi:ankyrin repeat protein